MAAFNASREKLKGKGNPLQIVLLPTLSHNCRLRHPSRLSFAGLVALPVTHSRMLSRSCGKRGPLEALRFGCDTRENLFWIGPVVVIKRRGPLIRAFVKPEGIRVSKAECRIAANRDC